MIQAWHSQAVWKPSGGGELGNAGWHRDIQYWPFWKPEGVFTAWIALTDVRKDSDKAERIEIFGENSDYLDMVNDASVCPILYKS